MLRSVILAASRSGRVERLVETAPLTSGVVRRFVAGDHRADALRVTRELVDNGLSVSLDHLGEDTTTAAHAAAARDEYLRLLDGLADDELTPAAEISVKLSALGQIFDEKVALEHARAICVRASEAGTTVTLDAEEHTTTDSTLEVLAQLRTEFPTTGAVLQSYLRRTESDCRDLTGVGQRVRLCKGAYDEPESVAYQSRSDVDRSYVRCLNVLLAGDGYPMVATHDPRLIAIAEDRARWFDRTPDEFEFQMLYGVRPAEQRRLAEAGYTVRVYVPYGVEWYPYLMRRLAERPANVAFFLRALRSTT
ncbi:MAG TPA: proline dehydrogenase family protein [Micromonosporaceae bacterium]|nr:proline dehydrogenase family protein [Micromonosporaceae bacterium]